MKVDINASANNSANYMGLIKRISCVMQGFMPCGKLPEPE